MDEKTYRHLIRRMESTLKVALRELHRADMLNRDHSELACVDCLEHASEKITESLKNINDFTAIARHQLARKMVLHCLDVEKARQQWNSKHENPISRANWSELLGYSWIADNGLN